jgi:hypothetical protein
VNLSPLARKVVLAAIAWVCLLIILRALLPEFIHRREFDQAFITWQKNSTPINETLLLAQRRKNMIIELETSAIGALIVLTAAFAGYEIMRRLRRTG